jgi:hypothetical protein
MRWLILRLCRGSEVGMDISHEGGAQGRFMGWREMFPRE